MKDDTEQDDQMARALRRYEIIGRYLALDPPRGKRRAVLEELASQPWLGPDGEPIRVAAETLRVWLRRYRSSGLAGLKDKPHPKRGVGVLRPEHCELVCQLKKDVPERSLERIITIAEDMKLAPPGVLRRSTVHRVLQSRGLSARKARIPDTQDLDRFEADTPNDLWQSDLLCGLWLPDPERAGKTRRADLYAFLDDHSRLVLHGAFSFRDNLPALELVLRRALQKWGVPRRLYYDNALVYHSQHMRQIVASLGIHRIVFTRVRRPMGHGKIEALNRLIRSAFLAEAKRSLIRTLDELNEAFWAWVDMHYHRKVHSETGETPIDRWRSNTSRVRYADEDKIRTAFLWKETRTPDKTGVLSLLGTRYQVGPRLARKRIELRFDPEAMHEVEVWLAGAFVERARPLDPSPWRRPQPQRDSASESDSVAHVDWLGHIVRARRADGVPSPASEAARVSHSREKKDQALIELLTSCVDTAVFDEQAIRRYLERFGPFDPEHAASTLTRLFRAGEPKDQHIRVYLDAIARAEKGSSS